MSGPWPTTAAPPPLPPGELHVWRAETTLAADALAAILSALPDDEQHAAQQVRIPAARARFIVARGLTRWLLAHYLQCDVRAVQLTYGPIGKLHLAPPEPLRFNATHSGDLVLVAIARDADVGVDVELLRPLPKFQELAERYYCQREIATLAALAADARHAAFFLAWTRKEALLKGVGKGLTFPLCDVEVTLTPGEPARLLKFGDTPGDAAPWRLWHLEPGEGYVGAVAATQPSLAVRQFSWQPV
jgi:4'-phosphopantetheinyl transferase